MVAEQERKRSEAIVSEITAERDRLSYKVEQAEQQAKEFEERLSDATEQLDRQAQAHKDALEDSRIELQVRTEEQEREHSRALDALRAEKDAELAEKQGEMEKKLAEMEKKGAAAAPKKQLTRAERRAQQEAQKAAKAAKNEGGGDGAGAGAGAGAPSKKAAAGSSAGDLQKVAAAAGDEASLSSRDTKEVVGNPARQAQRVDGGEKSEHGAWPHASIRWWRRAVEQRSQLGHAEQVQVRKPRLRNQLGSPMIFDEKLLDERIGESSVLREQ